MPHWPVEWGGQDWTDLQRHLWHEEMQRAGVPIPLAFNASMIGPVIAHFGTQEQKERFLPATANLDIWWSQGFSEPDAGSDLASLRTTAVRDGDDWVVNGQKTWTTLGQHGDWIFTLVRTDPEVKKQAGISMLLIDMTTPGVEVRPIELIDGGHEVNEVWFTDVRVPRRPAGRGAQRRLDHRQVPPRQRAGRRGARRRDQAGAGRPEGQRRPPAGRPPGPARVAELENELLALELTALRVVAHSSDGAPHPASSVLKLRGTELQQAVSELALDLAGPASLAARAGDDSPQEGWARRSAPTYLNLRKASIYGGSNEIQRQIISRTILGL